MSVETTAGNRQDNHKPSFLSRFFETPLGIYVRPFIIATAITIGPTSVAMLLSRINSQEINEQPIQELLRSDQYLAVLRYFSQELVDIHHNPAEVRLIIYLGDTGNQETAYYTTHLQGPHVRDTRKGQFSNNTGSGSDYLLMQVIYPGITTDSQGISTFDAVFVSSAESGNNTFNALTKK